MGLSVSTVFLNKGMFIKNDAIMLQREIPDSRVPAEASTATLPTALVGLFTATVPASLLCAEFHIPL